jgi:hypothetical protein
LSITGFMPITRSIPNYGRLPVGNGQDAVGFKVVSFLASTDFFAAGLAAAFFAAGLTTFLQLV